MKDKDQGSSSQGKPKKHGDFSKFMKKKTRPERPPKKEVTTGRRSRNETEPPVFDAPKRKPQRDYDKPVKRRTITKTREVKEEDKLIRLNKFISNSGVCSRREADQLIQTGAVKVNGNIVTELGTKVKTTDKIQVGEQTLTSEKPQYVLLNKPKGFITTTDDPFERKTVMALVEKACKERIYPVGRLDRNTTGLLLFTNDGELAKKLTHPRHQVRKIYHLYLDKPLARNDMLKITDGIDLDDGFIKPDRISFVGEGADKRDIGIELHSGKNRIVRRIFESLSYQVEKLDRVVFAGLTKKDLPRGRYRHLTKEEVNFLKML